MNDLLPDRVERELIAAAAGFKCYNGAKSDPNTFPRIPMTTNIPKRF
ncbi:MAG: hypothetical protein MUP09_05980 [Thiovulaceae bacterium]|nr:hypothetical protein [Sulfurimonadaceae bacterium]